MTEEIEQFNRIIELKESCFQNIMQISWILTGNRMIVKNISVAEGAISIIIEGLDLLEMVMDYDDDEEGKE